LARSAEGLASMLLSSYRGCIYDHAQHLPAIEASVEAGEQGGVQRISSS
jgi:hypothetical protein